MEVHVMNLIEMYNIIMTSFNKIKLVVCFRQTWDSFLPVTFLIFNRVKKRTHNSHVFLPVPTTSP